MTRMVAPIPPNPHQRADYIVRKLEQLIRDGKTVGGGMSFSTWQQLARAELANAFADIEKTKLRMAEDRTAKRLMAACAAAVVTIGFWGVVMAADQSFGRLPAILIFASGLVLIFAAGEWGLRRKLARHKAHQRLERFQRIEDLDKQIKRLENDLRKKLDRVKEEAEKAGLTR